MSKRFLLVMAVFVAIFIGLLFLNKKDAGAPTAPASSDGLTSRTYGEGKSGVKLIEYGDFQCPVCQQYYPIVRQIKEKYKDQITFQFNHFPIVSSHPKAMAAHRAAGAAARQGKFWEMHDLLYENQASWSQAPNPSSTFEGFASQIGLDLEKFKQDSSSESVATEIQADLKAGQDAGVNGTPGFLLDGKLIENPRSIEEFEKIIDEAIQKKTTG